MGVPIGSAMALHLLASAGYWLNPWYNDSHLIHLLVLLEYQCKPRKLWYNLVEPFIDTM
jgi:hypothetical protein